MDIFDWISCEDCNRSWHKTCVGIEASTPVEQVAWKKCASCGGADPEGVTLQSRRKVSSCKMCGKRLRGLDHKKCKQAMRDEVAAFRTPPAMMLSKREHPTISRKLLVPAKEKRAARKGRKRRKHKGVAVSEETLKKLRLHV